MNDDVDVTNAPKGANPGLVRPPFVYLGAIGLGSLLQVIRPVGLFSRWFTLPFGAVAVTGAVALFVYSVRTFRTAGTPVPGNLPTTTIVRSGPYGWSRNPIYLAFTLFHLGVAFCFNSFWVFLMLFPAVALMSFVVIPREERYLAAHFPSDYLSYKASVRRWI